MRGAEYDAWLIRIGEGDQFGSGLCRGEPQFQNPGASIGPIPSSRTRRVFESGSILLYLAEKFGAFLPKDRGQRGPRR